MRLDEIRRAARNPKLHDAAGIRESLTEFGVADLPVIDERTGLLVSGHGRLDQLAALAAAHKTPPGGVRVDPSGEWLLPVVRGWESANDAAAEAYIIGANKLAINGGWDDAGLAQMLADLVGADPDLAALTGFDPGELDDLMALLDADPIVHEMVPATAARYAETAEEQADRAERIAAYQPRVDRASGFSEVILVYASADRDEVGRLITAAREVLGSEVRAADVVLRALRVLMAVLDGRDDPAPVDCARLARHAGWEAGG